MLNYTVALWHITVTRYIGDRLIKECYSTMLNYTVALWHITVTCYIGDRLIKEC